MADDIEHQFDRMSRDSNERVRRVIAEAGRSDLLAEYDAGMKDIALGIAGARSTWNALSKAQRELLLDLRRDGGYIWRDPLNPSRCFHTRQNGMGSVHRSATVENLSRRNLLDWSAGASPSGSLATLSEKAQFILVHNAAQNAK